MKHFLNTPLAFPGFKTPVAVPLLPPPQGTAACPPYDTNSCSRQAEKKGNFRGKTWRRMCLRAGGARVTSVSGRRRRDIQGELGEMFIALKERLCEYDSLIWQIQPHLKIVRLKWVSIKSSYSYAAASAVCMQTTDEKRMSISTNSRRPSSGWQQFQHNKPLDGIPLFVKNDILFSSVVGINTSFHLQTIIQRCYHFVNMVDTA